VTKFVPQSIEDLNISYLQKAQEDRIAELVKAQAAAQEEATKASALSGLAAPQITPPVTPVMPQSPPVVQVPVQGAVIEAPAPAVFVAEPTMQSVPAAQLPLGAVPTAPAAPVNVAPVAPQPSVAAPVAPAAPVEGIQTTSVPLYEAPPVMPQSPPVIHVPVQGAVIEAPAPAVFVAEPSVAPTAPVPMMPSPAPTAPAQMIVPDAGVTQTFTQVTAPAVDPRAGVSDDDTYVVYETVPDPVVAMPTLGEINKQFLEVTQQYPLVSDDVSEDTAVCEPISVASPVIDLTAPQPATHTVLFEPLESGQLQEGLIESPAFEELAEQTSSGGGLRKLLRVIGIILWISTILMLLLTALGFLTRNTSVTSFFNKYGLYYQHSESMEPEINYGSLVLGPLMKGDDVQVGDDIVFDIDPNGTNQGTALRRVTNVVRTGDAATFDTVALADRDNSQEQFSADQVLMRSFLAIPLLGLAIDWLTGNVWWTIGLFVLSLLLVTLCKPKYDDDDLMLQ